MDLPILFCISFLFAVYLGHLFNLSPLFEAARSEDSVLEYLTFFFLAFVGFFLLGKSVRRKSAVPRVLFLVGAFAFLFVALEEVSWFQRILRFETPALLAEVNMQGEANVHNTANHVLPPIYAIGFFLLGKIFGSLSRRDDDSFTALFSTFNFGSVRELTSNYRIYSQVCYLTLLLFMISWSHAQELSEEIFAIIAASLALQSLLKTEPASEDK